MDGFSYTNIFETKGIEYLTIIAFFAVLVPFWFIVSRKPKRKVAATGSNQIISAASLRIPQGIFFSKFHTWAHMEESGNAKVGLDDLLVHITGDVEISQLKSPAEYIEKGEVLAVLRYNGNSLKILSPISGEIENINSTLNENPEIIRADPYRVGWIYAIKPTNWKAETNSYFLAEDATTWAVQELKRFKDFLAISASATMPQPVGVILQDGGELMEKPLAEFPQEIWDDFQKNFLS